MNRFLLVLAALVLLAGVVRLLVVYNDSRSGDQKILIKKSNR